MKPTPPPIFSAMETPLINPTRCSDLTSSRGRRRCLYVRQNICSESKPHFSDGSADYTFESVPAERSGSRHFLRSYRDAH